ncbi:MAG: hypothetical protein IJY62_00085 [Clostridia bacterium]|nr:hypothetical protein [Clostridia bacterium]
MKKYMKPILDAHELDEKDVITTSSGLTDGGAGGDIGEVPGESWGNLVG